MKTTAKIQTEIDSLEIQLDELENLLHDEPWNSEARQDFRRAQNRLNSLIAESVNA